MADLATSSINSSTFWMYRGAFTHGLLYLMLYSLFNFINCLQYLMLHALFSWKLRKKRKALSFINLRVKIGYHTRPKILRKGRSFSFQSFLFFTKKRKASLVLTFLLVHFCKKRWTFFFSVFDHLMTDFPLLVAIKENSVWFANFALCQTRETLKIKKIWALWYTVVFNSQYIYLFNLQSQQVQGPNFLFKVLVFN